LTQIILGERKFKFLFSSNKGKPLLKGEIIAKEEKYTETI
jgi:hypothetical protein